MIRRIGCRAHDYGQDTIEALTLLMADDGYNTSQLALKKALIDVEDLSHDLTIDLARHIHSVMSSNHMDVAVLGAYLNYAHPDEDTRERSIQVLAQHLRLANGMGARMVGTETGSLDAAYKAHSDNHGEAGYQRFMEAIQRIMPVADQANTYMAVEAVTHHVIHTPERMIRFVEDIHHPRLKVIFDINNMMTLDNLNQQEAMIHQMFDRLEHQIWAVHVKDFDFVDGEKRVVPLGEGLLKLDVLMDRVKKSSASIDVLAENIQRDRLHETSIMLASYVG